MTFQEWFYSAPHREKYTADHPAYLAAQESWNAAHEACAKVCDDFERAKWESVKSISQNGGRLAFAGPMHCADAIRARKDNT